MHWLSDDKRSKTTLQFPSIWLSIKLCCLPFVFSSTCRGTCQQQVQLQPLPPEDSDQFNSEHIALEAEAELLTSGAVPTMLAAPASFT